jgi:hypothetical protein
MRHPYGWWREWTSVSRTAVPARQWITNALEVLESVRHAVEDFHNAPTESRAKTAIRNFLEQGRSVTWALQHLKSSFASKEEGQKWWDATCSELRSNPVAKWFYDLRNPVVKEGQPVNIRGVARLEGRFSFPPPNETRPPGATGWVLDSQLVPWWTMPDGSKVPARPIEGVRRWNTLANVPAAFRDRPLTDLMAEYVAVLEKVAAAAMDRFGSQ